MRRLVDEIQSSTPRPRSPHMNNEEPIELSHYPDGRAPSDEEDVDENGDVGGDEADGETEVDGQVVKKKKKKRREAPIERDDFPAPPYAYAGPGFRRRHWSEPSTTSRRSSGATTPVVLSSEDEDEIESVDPKFQKTEEELKKIAEQSKGAMGAVFLQVRSFSSPKEDGCL